MFSLLFLQFLEMTWCEIKSVSFCLSVLDLASSSCHSSLGQSLFYDRRMAVSLQLGWTKYRFTSALHFQKMFSWPYGGGNKQSLASASATILPGKVNSVAHFPFSMVVTSRRQKLNSESTGTTGLIESSRMGRKTAEGDALPNHGLWLLFIVHDCISEGTGLGEAPTGLGVAQ